MTEVKPKEVQLSVERVPGTLSTASKSVQVNGAATVSIDSSFLPFYLVFSAHGRFLIFAVSQTPQSPLNQSHPEEKKAN